MYILLRRSQQLLRRKIGLFVILTCINFGGASTNVAEAAALGPEALAPSLAAYLLCEYFSGRDCLAILADPEGEGITRIGFTMQYDPTQWEARLDGSGFLCDFSENGDCPPAEAQLGRHPLHTGLTHPGDPLDGSSLTLTADNTLGLLVFDYQLSTPLTISEDRNFFLLAFLPVNPFPGRPVATYFGQPGNYDFSITSFVCEAVVDGQPGTCGSNTPIYGFDIDFEPIPEPSTWLLLGTGLLGMLGRAYRRL